MSTGLALTWPAPWKVATMQTQRADPDILRYSGGCWKINNCIDQLNLARYPLYQSGGNFCFNRCASIFENDVNDIDGHKRGEETENGNMCVGKKEIGYWHNNHQTRTE